MSAAAKQVSIILSQFEGVIDISKITYQMYVNID